MKFIHRLYFFFRPDFFAEEKEQKLTIKQKQDEVLFLEQERKRLEQEKCKWQRAYDRYRNFHETVASDCLEQAKNTQKQLDKLMNGRVGHG